MKTLVIILLALVAATGSGFAQDLIAVQNGGEPKFFVSLDEAVTNSLNGDTLFLSGGIYAITQTINKTLHIIGNGYHPDSTVAKGVTYIQNDIYLGLAASNGSITGILINNLIMSEQGIITNYSVRRCFTQSIQGPFSNSTFSENIVKHNFFINGSSCFYYNNIIEGLASPYFILSHSTFKNNIFLAEIGYDGGGWNYCPVYSNQSLFENNIFLSTVQNPILNCPQSFFRNNLFVFNWEGPDNQGGFFGSGNIVNQLQQNIFVNQSGNTFDYKHDYQIKEGCPGKNGGVDGTDVGIYGGIYPWKDGGLPFNPHIKVAKIAGTTDANGNLNVNIKVEAQER
jgi:hypothetical protein